MPRHSAKWFVWGGLCASTMNLMAAPKVLPVLNKPIKDLQVLAGFPLNVNLNTRFGTEAIDDQIVRFTSHIYTNGNPIFFDMAIFSNRTPVTRTNFLKYVNDGDYVNSFIHRSDPGFVIQGGGFRIANSLIQSVPADPPIVNEFGVSNTVGTISMAKLGGDPNSATSQWFINMGANSDGLDTLNGGFTVFGRITKSTFSNAQVFGNPTIFPIFNYTETFGSSFGQLPLLYTHSYGNPQFREFILFPTVSRVSLPAGQAGESTTLTYLVVSNSNPTVATASIQSSSTLSLNPQAGKTGSTTITVRATDSVANFVEDTFVLKVNAADTYTSWASRTEFSNSQSGILQNPDGDSLNNLQEYAFFGSPSASSQMQVPVRGVTGTPPAAQHMTLTFPIRKFTTGLSYVVEANNSLSGTWTTVWSSANDFSHPQVVTAVNQTDRTVVTIKDTAAIGSTATRFLRTRVVQN
jgi:cyclophilin family peptidyl-prolyl cis-trans isomerase